MNGCLWRIEFLEPYAEELVDRTGQIRVATTDPLKHTIFLSRALNGDFLKTVLLHELSHAAMVSYSMLNEIHHMVHPRYWIDMEEWICNFLADYGSKIFKTADIITKNDP